MAECQRGCQYLCFNQDVYDFRLPAATNRKQSVFVFCFFFQTNRRSFRRKSQFSEGRHERFHIYSASSYFSFMPSYVNSDLWSHDPHGSSYEPIENPLAGSWSFSQSLWFLRRKYRNCLWVSTFIPDLLFFILLFIYFFIALHTAVSSQSFFFFSFSRLGFSSQLPYVSISGRYHDEELCGMSYKVTLYCMMHYTKYLWGLFPHCFWRTGTPKYRTIQAKV